MSPSELAALLGLKFGALIAGFAGAVGGVAHMRDLSLPRAALYALVGMFAAAYTAPPVAAYLGLDASAENAGAFVLGVISMNLVGLAFDLAKQLRADPIAFLDRWRRR